MEVPNNKQTRVVMTATKVFPTSDFLEVNSHCMECNLVLAVMAWSDVKYHLQYWYLSKFYQENLDAC